MATIDKISATSEIPSSLTVVMPSVERIAKIARCALQPIQEGICLLGTRILNCINKSWSLSQNIFVHVRQVFQSVFSWDSNPRNQSSIENRPSVLQPSFQAAQMANHLALEGAREDLLVPDLARVDAPLLPQVDAELPLSAHEVPASRSFSIRSQHSRVLEAVRLLDRLFRRCEELSLQTQLKKRLCMSSVTRIEVKTIDDDYFMASTTPRSSEENKSSSMVEVIESQGAHLERLDGEGNRSQSATAELRDKISQVTPSPQQAERISETSQRVLQLEAQIEVMRQVDREKDAIIAEKDARIERLEATVILFQRQMNQMQEQMQVLMNAVALNPPAPAGANRVVPAPAAANRVVPAPAAVVRAPQQAVVNPPKPKLTDEERRITQANAYLVLSASVLPYAGIFGGVPGVAIAALGSMYFVKTNVAQP